MLILALETATESVGVALGTADGPMATVEVARGRRHTETLVPAVEFVCRQADVALAEVTSVAVDVGPGLFTGMRVGIATAKAFAMALDIGVIPVSSLEVLAGGVDADDRVVVPVVDTRKGEVAWSMMRMVDGRPHRLTEPTIGSVDDLVADLMARDQPSVCVGDGAARYREDIIDGVGCAVAAPVHPSPVALLAAGVVAAVDERWCVPHEVEPLYLREPDATINWTTRQVRP